MTAGRCSAPIPLDALVAYWAQDWPFLLERHGYPEETYFDISYDPVRDEFGLSRHLEHRVEDVPDVTVDVVAEGTQADADLRGSHSGAPGWGDRVDEIVGQGFGASIAGWERDRVGLRAQHRVAEEPDLAFGHDRLMRRGGWAARP